MSEESESTVGDKSGKKHWHRNKIAILSALIGAAAVIIAALVGHINGVSIGGLANPVVTVNRNCNVASRANCCFDSAQRWCIE
jgi:hypothetical protein